MADDGSIFYTKIVLPFLIAFLTGLVGNLFKALFDAYERDHKRRTRELKSSQKIHDEVIFAMDNLYTNMKYNAWNAANRKAIDDSSITTDPEDWQNYVDSLEYWRLNDLIYRSQISNYFEDRIVKGNEEAPLKEQNEALSDVITHVTEKFNVAAEQLWTLYWKTNRAVIPPVDNNDQDIMMTKNSSGEENFGCFNETFQSFKDTSRKVLGSKEELHIERNLNTNGSVELSIPSEERMHAIKNDLEQGQSTRSLPNFQQAVQVQNVDPTKPAVQAPPRDHVEEHNQKLLFQNTLHDIDDIIQMLSKCLTQDIQDENVGKLRKKKKGPCC